MKWFQQKFEGVLEVGKPMNVSNFQGRKGKKK
jgi:hypothetical protein